MWEINWIHPDPLASRNDGTIPSTAASSELEPESRSCILSASASIEDLLGKDPTVRSAFAEGQKTSRVGLADVCARHFGAAPVAKTTWTTQDHHYPTSSTAATINAPSNVSVRLEGLDDILCTKRNRRRSTRQRRLCHPYVVERSDFYCGEDGDRLHATLRVVMNAGRGPSDMTTILPSHSLETMQTASVALLEGLFPPGDPSFCGVLLQHVACLVLQQRIRSRLASMGAVAFVGDGSVLPRASGTSQAPMASPPAVPFRAPSGSRMTTTISIARDEFGSALAEHLPESMRAGPDHHIVTDGESSKLVLSGLIVPKGITLICGGGYHGKSTLLQAIAVGHYDKIPGDGRELCVSLSDAVVVRAEDGRYVNNCNISAFISNLPTPPGVTNPLDTEHFSTRDSSGSTSQAANVSEAIEFGARALLVDEDISAANFMARDGRMRALVMDESITPLLYRVNGLYNTHGISTVVVVGGVGDWLDVPHNVILLDKYVVFDATAKAQSISRQFSYGHVQYAGRGVVHRLEWEKKGTPKLRRPTDLFAKRFDSDVIVSLLDGGRGLVLYKEINDKVPPANTECQVAVAMEDDSDEEEGNIDASRLGQLLGKKQLFATGLCVAWILQNVSNHADAGLRDLLKLLDSVLETDGMNRVVNELKETEEKSRFSKSMIQMLESVGNVERPRIFEIGQALVRMRGIRFDEMPMHDDGSEEAARIEEENKKKALAALWAKRRSKKS